LAPLFEQNQSGEGDRAQEKTVVTSKLRHVSHGVTIKRPHDGGSGGLGTTPHMKEKGILSKSFYAPLTVLSRVLTNNHVTPSPILENAEV
jgi:hypothetical protein